MPDLLFWRRVQDSNLGRLSSAIYRTPQALWSNSAGTVLIANIVGHQMDVLGHSRFVKLPGTMPPIQLDIAW